MVLVATPTTGQDSLRVLSARDTLRINQVGTPRLSPDGRWVLYTLTSREMQDEELAATTQLWRVRVDGRDNHQLTRGDQDARSPTWSPDGQVIAFLSARDMGPEAKTQIHFMRADGGEAWQVTEHAESVTRSLFSPDGTKVLFMAEDALPEDEQKKRDRKDDAEAIDEVFQMVHLWIHDLDTDETARLTEGAFTVANPDWSPDSRRITFERRPNPSANDRWQSDIWLVESATGVTRQLYENGGSDTGPEWSPDGRTIAYASNRVSGSNTLHNNLHLISSEGGEPRVLLDDIDRDFSNPIWAMDGRHVYWSIGSGTSTQLFSVSVESGASVPLATLATAGGMATQGCVCPSTSPVQRRLLRCGTAGLSGGVAGGATPPEARGDRRSRTDLQAPQQATEEPRPRSGNNWV